MFILKLYDRLGNELHEGDFVKVSCHDRFDNYFKYFAKVEYLEAEKIISPFHTFSFHSFEKVDKIPDKAVLFKSNDSNIEYWFLPDPEKDTCESAERYLMSWRECEYNLDERCYRVEKI